MKGPGSVAVGMVWTALLTPSCGGDEKGGTGSTVAPGNTPCDKVRSVATRAGCNATLACSLSQGCDSQYNAFLDCIYRDISQCHCESDDGLNCEGAWKPDEGPARCIPEYEAMDECESGGGRT